ncbi:MAG: hypothetical protein HFJ32_00480 [Clostridia bacterium]|nr:hypothetical protein [Clostridia bacterium]
MEVNEEKRVKFMENAGKRVNKVMHDIQILEPMARSSVYDFTKGDVEEMFLAMQESLNTAKAEFEKKFEEKTKAERRLFSFGTNVVPVAENNNNTSNSTQVPNNNVNVQNIETVEETVVANANVGDITDIEL